MTPDDFSASYTRLLNWMRSRILSATNPDSLLKIARLYGQLRWANADGTYSDDAVEEQIANRILKAGRFESPAKVDRSESTVLVASDLYDSGGHSRVVRNWLKSFREENNHRLLVTRSMTEGFQSFLNANRTARRLCSTEGIQLVQEIIAGCGSAPRIVLHIHPDDITSAVAARLLSRAGREIIFYNHADHVFSFGIPCANVVAEVSSYGIEVSRQSGRAKRSSFLGIPIDIGTPSKSNTTPSPIVLTSGAAYKYRPADRFFGEFVDKLFLQQPQATIVFIGPTGSEPWWTNREQWGNRVHFLGQVPHAQFTETMALATVYVDSFPITGGTAFAEALLNGKLITGLRLPIQGYSPADELRVDTTDQLAERVAALLTGNSAAVQEVDRVRIEARDVHSLDSFHDRVLALYAGNYETSPWESRVAVDTHWIERQWRTATKIHDIEDARFFDLPFSFCLGFLRQLSRLHMSFAINRLILRSMPRPLRNRMIALRETSLKGSPPIPDKIQRRAGNPKAA